MLILSWMLKILPLVIAYYSVKTLSKKEGLSLPIVVKQKRNVLGWISNKLPALPSKPRWLKSKKIPSLMGLLMWICIFVHGATLSHAVFEHFSGRLMNSPITIDEGGDLRNYVNSKEDFLSWVNEKVKAGESNVSILTEENNKIPPVNQLPTTQQEVIVRPWDTAGGGSIQDFATTGGDSIEMKGGNNKIPPANQLPITTSAGGDANQDQKQVTQTDPCSVKLSERRAPGFSEETVFPNIQANRDPSVFDRLDFNRLSANPVVSRYLDVRAENSVQIVEEAGYLLNPDSTFIDIFNVTRAIEVESGVSEKHRDGVIYGMFCGEAPSAGMGVEVKYEMVDSSYEYFSGVIASVVRNGESNFTISVNFDGGDESGTFEYPSPDLDIQLDRDMILVKVGWTRNTTDRLINYRLDPNNYRDFNATCQMLGLVFFDSIPYDVDQLLAQQKLGLFQDVINDPEAEGPLKVIFESMLSQNETENGREWHRGGPGRGYAAQILEYGVQKRLSRPGRLLDSPAEGFMFNNTKYDYMVDTAVEGADELIIINDNFISEHLRNMNVVITHISTWATGCKEGKLSSAIVSGEFMIGPNGTWFDTMPQAQYPNAKTEEEMFDNNFNVDQYDEADQRLCTNLQQPPTCPDEPHVMYVDTQGYMYGDMVEIQKVAYRLGFRHSGTVHGVEIIVYKHTECMTQIKFHGHLAEAADSRPVKSVLDAEKRGITISALKQDRRYLTGQAVNATDGFDDSAIIGTQVTEILHNGLHLVNMAKKFAVVPYKDLVTPTDVSATDRCDLKMTPAYANGGSFLNPSSDQARTSARRDSPTSEFTMNKVINRFSNATHDTLPSFLTRFDNQVSNGRPVCDRNNIWNKIMTEYLPSVEREALVISIDDWAKENGKVVRVKARRRWTLEEDAQVLAVGSLGAQVAFGGWTQDQVISRWTDLGRTRNEKKRKAAAELNESRKKQK